MLFFLHQQSKYKVINKDQWCNVLEFSRTINLDLSNYDEDGACKYWVGIAFPPSPAHLLLSLVMRSLIAVLFPPSLLSLSSGPVLLDEFVEWYKDKQMS